MISSDTPSRRGRKMRYAFEALSGGMPLPESAEAQQNVPTSGGQLGLVQNILNVLNQRDKIDTPQHSGP